MDELTDLDSIDAALTDTDTLVLVRLSFRGRGREGRRFNVEKAALQQMGAAYDYRLRVWRVPSDHRLAGPLSRMLTSTSAVIYSAHVSEELSADMF